MPFTMFGRTIRKIGVIGSGNIGPDIALHFSQNLLAYKDIREGPKVLGREKTQGERKE